METLIYESIREVEEVEWDSIVNSSSIICTHRFLLAVEASDVNDCRYFYPVVRAGGVQVAHTCVYTISTQLDSGSTGVVKALADLIRKVWKRFLCLRTLECGTPVALGNTVSFAEGVDKRRVLAEMCGAIETLRRRLRIPVVVWRDFYDADLAVFDALPENGYRRICAMPVAKIDVAWKSFEEYLASLRSHYRYKINKRIRKCRRGGVAVEVLKDFAQYADVLAGLWRNTYDHAREYKREILTAKFFRSVSEYLKNDVMLIMMSRDSVPIGFSLVLCDRVNLASMYVGLNYEYNSDFSVYYNLFYETLGLGISSGFEKFCLGITCLESKKTLGAKIVPLYAYVKGCRPWLTLCVCKCFEISMMYDYACGAQRIFRSGNLRYIAAESNGGAV